MFRERGSDQIEVVGGRYDGAVGQIVDMEDKDGRRLVRVKLAGGLVITVADEIPAGGTELPREMGT